MNFGHIKILFGSIFILLTNIAYSRGQSGDYLTKLCDKARSGNFENKSIKANDPHINSYLLECAVGPYVHEVSLKNGPHKSDQYDFVNRNKQKTADYFLSGPLDLSHKDDGGRNILMSVVVSYMPVAWKEKAITVLLKRGVDLAEKDRNGDTALDLAKIRGDAQVVKFLSR